LITGHHRPAGLAIAGLLEIIDTYLLAIVQLIVVIGLYELFVGPLKVPAWLKARSLDDLEKSIIDVLIIYNSAVAVLIIAFTLFTRRSPPTQSQ